LIEILAIRVRHSDKKAENARQRLEAVGDIDSLNERFVFGRVLEMKLHRKLLRAR
jgi:hypothetical protein